MRLLFRLLDELNFEYFCSCSVWKLVDFTRASLYHANYTFFTQLRAGFFRLPELTKNFQIVNYIPENFRLARRAEIYQ